MKNLINIIKKSELPLIVAHNTDEFENINIRLFYDKENKANILTNNMSSPFSPINGKSLLPKVKSTAILSADDLKKSLVIIGEDKENGITYRTTPEIAKLIGSSGIKSFIGIVSATKITANVDNHALASILNKNSIIAEDDELEDDSMNDDMTDDGIEMNMDNDDSMNDDIDNMDDDNTDDEIDLDELDMNNDDNTDDNTDNTDDNDDDNNTNDDENKEDDVTVNESESEGGDDTEINMDDDNTDDEINNDNNDDMTNNLSEDKTEDTNNNEAPVDDTEMNMDNMDDDNTDDNLDLDNMDFSEDSEVNYNDNIDDEDMDTSMASISLFSNKASFDNKRLDIVISGNENPIWYLMVDNLPVAYMKSENASDNVKEIFGNINKFKSAFFTAIETSNNKISKEIIEEFGINPLKFKIKANDIINNEIKKRVKKVKAALDKKEKEYADKLQQCISIASVGINKGFFKSIRHPLKDKFIEELSKHNVRFPHKIIDSVFASAGEEYQRVVVQKAKDLVIKNDDARNDLSTSIIEASYQHTNYDDPSDIIINRIENGNIASDHIDNNRKSVTSNISNVSNLRQKLKLSNSNK